MYGSLGMSHHATEDIAMMCSLPDVTVLAPGDLVEAVKSASMRSWTALRLAKQSRFKKARRLRCSKLAQFLTKSTKLAKN